MINGSSTGVVLLTSHVGNWQLAMSALGQLEKTVYLVMLPEYNEAVRDALKMRREQEQIKFISSAGHLGGVVDIMNVLKRGDMVSIMGDRTENFEGASVPFLGDQARLPYGPFQIAATARCPVLFLFSSKTGLKDYRIDLSQAVTPVLTDRKSRREKLQGWVADYARRLEAYTETFPMQCFIFRDLWENSPVE